MPELRPTHPDSTRFHQFGAYGPVYETLETVDDKTIRIRVVETGEILNYSRAQSALDPLA